MAPYYPPPDTSSLLQPLLACLPIAYISSRPPPALLPLLSPILRQRVNLLAETRSTSEASWLPLLCWDTEAADELSETVKNLSFEAHPVSGEMEFGDIEPAQYRRLDEETLQSRTALSDMELVVTYTWCTNDTEGGEDGWRISELKPLKTEVATSWYSTFTEADAQFKTNSDPITRAVQGQQSPPQVEEEEEADDSYWAQYDQQASETPAHGHTPVPRTNARGQEEDDYYSRYDQVQPEMDPEDNLENQENVGASTLPGNVLLGPREYDIHPTSTSNIVQTRPSSSSSSAVAQLEQSAEHQSQAEIAIQQHIGFSLKSLYRLAKGAGIDNAEFRRLVENEMECLSMMDGE